MTTIGAFPLLVFATFALPSIAHADLRPEVEAQVGLGADQQMLSDLTPGLSLRLGLDTGTWISPSIRALGLVSKNAPAVCRTTDDPKESNWAALGGAWLRHDFGPVEGHLELDAGMGQASFPSCNTYDAFRTDSTGIEPALALGAGLRGPSGRTLSLGVDFLVVGIVGDSRSTPQHPTGIDPQTSAFLLLTVGWRGPAF